MTIWHLGLNKSPIVSLRMPYDCCLAVGYGKNGNQKGERSSLCVVYTSTFV